MNAVSTLRVTQCMATQITITIIVNYGTIPCVKNNQSPNEG